jgi:hypothetical protein
MFMLMLRSLLRLISIPRPRSLLDGASDRTQVDFSPEHLRRKASSDDDLDWRQEDLPVTRRPTSTFKLLVLVEGSVDVF